MPGSPGGGHDRVDVIATFPVHATAKAPCARPSAEGCENERHLSHRLAAQPAVELRPVTLEAENEPVGESDVEIQPIGLRL
jgi:hypothetical protein